MGMINPFIAVFNYLGRTLLYVPFKHEFLLLTNDEWLRIKNGSVSDELISKRVIVSDDYPDRFVNHYRGMIGRPQLDLMYLLLTDYCNFRCPYCFIENNYSTSERSFMSWVTAERAIKLFFNNVIGDGRIIFYGGEPLLNKSVIVKAVKLVRSINKRTELGVNSNGSVYDKELSNLFKRNNVTLSVSLDSFPVINDFTRVDEKGHGTSKLVISNIKRFIADGVNVSLSITINGYNIDYLPAFAKYIVKEFPQVRSAGFNLPLQNVKGNDLFVDPEYSAFQVYNAFRVFRYHGVYEDRVMRRLKHLINKSVYLKDCGACGNQIVISPDGRVGVCHGLVGLGKDFAAFDGFDFYNNEVVNKWNRFSPVNNPHCVSAHCPYLLICGNSCPYYSFITSGDLSAPDKRMCSFLPRFIQSIGKDLNYLPVKNLLIDYDGVIISRPPVLDLLRIVKERVGSSYELVRQRSYDIRSIVTAILEQSSVPVSRVNDYIYLYHKLFTKDSVLNQPLINQLRVIKRRGVRLFIYSNSSRDLILKELGSGAGLFDGIFTFKNKYLPESLASTLKEVNASLMDTLYVGDSFSDIKPLLDLGLRGVSFYCNPELFKELSNDWLVDVVNDSYEE